MGLKMWKCVVSKSSILTGTAIIGKSQMWLCEKLNFKYFK